MAAWFTKTGAVEVRSRCLALQCQATEGSFRRLVTLDPGKKRRIPQLIEPGLRRQDSIDRQEKNADDIRHRQEPLARECESSTCGKGWYRER
jgi:hypothetical protein